MSQPVKKREEVKVKSWSHSKVDQVQPQEVIRPVSCLCQKVNQRMNQKVFCGLLVVVVLVACLSELPGQVQAGGKEGDVVVYGGKIIVRGGKKEGDVVVGDRRRRRRDVVLELLNPGAGSGAAAV